MSPKKAYHQKNNQSVRLFTAGLPVRQWLEFNAQGFAAPVSGAIFTAEQPPCCGVPLGGLATGCLDIDPRGVFGYTHIFNPGSWNTESKYRYPRRAPDLHPFLGVSAGGKTWVLASPDMGSGEQVDWCTEPQVQRSDQGWKFATIWRLPTPKLEGVAYPKRIDYWGHYPVADMEFELDSPLSVGLRAWSPLIPGDAAASNMPAAVFEVYLRNTGSEIQSGTLAFSFNGPTLEEARSSEFIRSEVNEDFRGVQISSLGNVHYLLGVLDGEAARFGASLNREKQSWTKVTSSLPQPYFHQVGERTIYQDGSCSAAVNFNLAPGEEKVVRFILAWFAPEVEGGHWNWEGKDNPGEGFMRTRWIGSEWAGRVHYFTHMYASRYASALEVARTLQEQHVKLLKRILAWQAEIYNEHKLPTWLRDSLVNNLALIAEDSYWFQPKAPLGDWAFPGGAFALNESPRGCPHMSCIPCDWYGNLPLVFFFPEQARSSLVMFREYQKEDGEIPFALGKIADLPDMASPEFYWQVSLNGMCYIDMVDRLWQRTGDDSVLKEFYASVKRANTFTMDLRKGPGGPISMPTIGGMEWFEFGDWAGRAAHLGGLRLAELRMVERMAEAVGDKKYAEQCREWYADGSRAMEDELWAGSYYLNFYEKETGKRSDDVMAYQLDGEWTARYHGLPGVFRSERVVTALDTIRKVNIALAPEVGAVNFARPDGVLLDGGSKVAFYGRYTMFVPEMALLAMTYAYAGEVEYGKEILRKHWETLCLKQGHAWDLPNMVVGDSGRRIYGTDYYQNMMLWAVPAAFMGEDLKGSCREGGLINRILRAGASKKVKRFARP